MSLNNFADLNIIEDIQENQNEQLTEDQDGLSYDGANASPLV